MDAYIQHKLVQATHAKPPFKRTLCQVVPCDRRRGWRASQTTGAGTIVVWLSARCGFVAASILCRRLCLLLVTTSSGILLCATTTTVVAFRIFIRCNLSSTVTTARWFILLFVITNLATVDLAIAILDISNLAIANLIIVLALAIIVTLGLSTLGFTNLATSAVIIHCLAHVLACATIAAHTATTIHPGTNVVTLVILTQRWGFATWRGIWPWRISSISETTGVPYDAVVLCITITVAGAVTWLATVNHTVFINARCVDTVLHVCHG